MEEDIKILLSIGLSEQKVKETLKNVQVTKNLKIAIQEVSKVSQPNSTNGTLLYHLSSKIKAQILDKIPLISRYIGEEKIDTIQRVDAALEYLLQHVSSDFNRVEFEKACGVGVVVTPQQIQETVKFQIDSRREEIISKRYRFNTGQLMQEVRNTLKWADGKSIKNEVDSQIFTLLGPKTEADTGKKPKEPKQKVQELNGENLKKDPITMKEYLKSRVNFHAPGENYKTEGYVVTPKTEALLKKHLKETGGKVKTRFPPEPNGILHIGHAKAININFGYAEAHNGTCYLRYDDTNPEKEEEKFVTGILDMVQWLGYKPAKITYSSDYFDQLFEWAVILIKKGLAYVCHQRSSEIKGFNPPPSPWRDRPIEENLRLFYDMKDGVMDEGEATLRMKVTLEEGKQDPVAYRIKYSQHHHTGDKWCIYPTYDYTHCLCDSIENITHSLCTKEFQSRRSSYYWLCNALEIYCPVQWEYGRLNVNYTVVSKRKIAKLIDEKIVSDWDDPRLFTLTALRRRGFPSEAINNFCAQMGVTGAQTTVDPMALEAAVRDVLNASAPRHMVVLEPLKITIKNFPTDQPSKLDVPDFPDNANKQQHSIIFDRIVYIEASDFKEIGEKDFRRLTPNQTVGLKYSGVVLKVDSVEKNSNGEITNVTVTQEPVSENNKPKAFIHWVSQPVKATVRLYERLFLHPNPEDTEQVPGGFLTDVNPKSVSENTAFIDQSLEGVCKPLEKFQFERIGFFSVDPDTKENNIVFNRAVTLKESAGK